MDHEENKSCCGKFAEEPETDSCTEFKVSQILVDPEENKSCCGKFAVEPETDSCTEFKGPLQGGGGGVNVLAQHLLGDENRRFLALMNSGGQHLNFYYSFI